MNLLWKQAGAWALLGVVLGPPHSFGRVENGPAATPTPFDRPSSCRTPGLTVPDDTVAGVDDSLVISSGSPIADLDVLVRMTHNYVGDLVVTLTHMETGTAATLIDRPLLPPKRNGEGCAGTDVDVLLDDEGSAPVEDSCKPLEMPAIRGRLIPNEPLSAFDGESLAGTWILNVSDRSFTDVGTLDAWCLVYGDGPPDTPTVTPTSSSSTPTRTASRTATQPAATTTPTRTITPPVPTFTPTQTPTDSPTQPTSTVTATRTNTPTFPTFTATRTPTVTPTVPTSTPTETPTITPTGASPTSTPPVDATSTRTPTSTPTGSSTATRTSTPPTNGTSTPTPSPTPTPPIVCTGDCNLDRMVSIDELVMAVDITLSRLGLDACPALDADRSSIVTIDEPIAAVANAVGGCN